MTNKTLADLLKEESERFNSYCYIDYPYPCMITEALIYARKYGYPHDCKITRTEDQTTIELKPLKGSRKRKPYIIKLWRC